jgi:hypothetical protein
VKRLVKYSIATLSKVRRSHPDPRCFPPRWCVSCVMYVCVELRRADLGRGVRGTAFVRTGRRCIQ